MSISPQVATGFLNTICTDISHGLTGGGSGEVDIIKVVTEPFVDLIVQVCHMPVNFVYNCLFFCLIYSHLFATQINSTVLDEWAIGNCHNCELQQRHCPEFDSPDKCNYFFNLFEWEDWIVGTILAVVSLVMLCGCLILMVKLLNSLLKGEKLENNFVFALLTV